MSFWKKIQRQREADQEYVEAINQTPESRYAKVTVNDPLAVKIGRTYTTADIERLEEEFAPWLRKRRR